jgi:hypothetical protein
VGGGGGGRGRLGNLTTNLARTWRTSCPPWATIPRGWW